jgi:hypothetical protein
MHFNFRRSAFEKAGETLLLEEKRYVIAGEIFRIRISRNKCT